MPSENQKVLPIPGNVCHLVSFVQESVEKLYIKDSKLKFVNSRTITTGQCSGAQSEIALQQQLKVY